MNYFYITLAACVALFIIRSQWRKRKEAIERKRIAMNDRTIDEIYAGRTDHEVFEELDGKEHDQLTPNELQVLLSIHLSWEHNSPGFNHKS